MEYPVGGRARESGGGGNLAVTEDWKDFTAASVVSFRLFWWLLCREMSTPETMPATTRIPTTTQNSFRRHTGGFLTYRGGRGGTATTRRLRLLVLPLIAMRRPFRAYFLSRRDTRMESS